MFSKYFFDDSKCHDFSEVTKDLNYFHIQINKQKVNYENNKTI